MQIKRKGADIWEEAEYVVGFLTKDGDFISKKEVSAERTVDNDIQHCFQCLTLNTGKIFCKHDSSTKSGIVGFCERCQDEQQIDFVLE